MITNSFTKASRSKLTFFLLPLILFSLIFATNCLAAGQKAIILPLKVQTVGSSINESSRADQALEDAMRDEGFISISRDKAEKLANYDATWPPTNATFKSIAAKTGYNYVAAGTITAIGELISIDIKTVDNFASETPVFFYRHAIPKEQLSNAIKSLVAEVATYADKERRIVAITPKGNKRVDSGAILRKISSKSGDVYNPVALRDDLKTIYSMGYFNDVQVNVEDTKKGKVVTFTMIEKPIISSIIYNGISELKEEDVKAVANIKEYRVLNPTQITIAKESMLALYEMKGYYNCKIESTINYPANSGAIVTFDINEGSKVYIENITFEGNNNFDADDLRDAMETSEKSWLTWLTADGLLDMVKIKQDAGRIGAFYNNHGYLDAKVGEPEVTRIEDGMQVNFVINEGPRYRLGTIDFAGDLIIDKKRLVAMLTIRKDKYVDRQKLRDNIMDITDAYSELGYAFADVRPRTTKSKEGHRLDVLFDIRKNDLVYIDRITISGNSRTRDNVIRRELRIVEGGLFDSAAIRRSNKALERLNYFEEVSITPEPTSDPSRMNVNVRIKEKPTGTFSIGVGYSTSDGVIFSGSIRENNFLGRGDILELSGKVGDDMNDFNLGYTNPRLNDSFLSWGVDIFINEREYDDYDKAVKGFGFRIGYPIWREWRLYANYSLTDTELTDISKDASYIIKESANINITSAMKFTFVEDTRNRTFMATEGHRTSISFKYAGGPLFGDAEFFRTEATTGWYFPLFLGTTLHLKGSVGYVTETKDDALPVYERFFLGGTRSMRGFEYADVGPLDKTGEKVGGTVMWYTNVEFIFPIAESQGVAGMVFFDMGQVKADDWDDTTPLGYCVNGECSDGQQVRKDIGVGMMWNSPMGPLVLTWGYNLDPVVGEDESVVDFSMGGKF
ncbi:MAG: outer membrane protein assembly factor BamA [Desulfotalea sp.]